MKKGPVFLTHSVLWPLTYTTACITVQAVSLLRPLFNDTSKTSRDTECFTLTNSDLKSLNFAANRFFDESVGEVIPGPYPEVTDLG